MTGRKGRRPTGSRVKRRVSAAEWFPRYIAVRDVQLSVTDGAHKQVLALIEERVEEIATKINAAYLTLPEERRNPDIVAAFEKLPPFYKASNRAAARRIPSSLLAAGMRVVPRKNARPEAEARAWLDRFIDLAAAEEHRGWCEFHVKEGWTPTATQDSPRDRENKRHEALFPWEVLYESNRDKDRRQVRIYLKIVYALGFGVTWE